MSNEPLIIERHYNAPIEKGWQALTDTKSMRQWYFDIAEFKPEPGFKFSFEAGPENRSYLHLCEVTEAIPNKKLSYTWRYEGFEGNSVVTFELFNENGGTRLKLTHIGLETFPQDIPDFAKHNFQEGWAYFAGTALKNFVENVQF